VGEEGELRYLESMEAAYRQEFSTTVKSLPPGAVVLEATYFYPTGGGQASDCGTLTTPEGARVDVVEVERKGGLTLHRLGKGGANALQRGMVVQGHLDWERRFRHMRLHTAQHLLSALAFQRFGIRTARAQMSGRGGTVDLEAPLPTEDAVPSLGREASERYFSQHVPVQVRFVDRATFEALPGRSGAGKLPAGLTRIRLIEIDGIDRCPCGGTHVQDTAEVGEVRLLSHLPLPTGGARLSFELAESPASPRDPKG
jgi:misacylated tRNA(Ala) deacylase